MLIEMLNVEVKQFKDRNADDLDVKSAGYYSIRTSCGI